MFDSDPTLRDLLASAADGNSQFETLPENRVTPLAGLWELADCASGALDSKVPIGGTVAIAIEATAASIASLLGSIRAGCRVVSLPSRPRGTSPEGYQRWVSRIFSLCEPSLVISEVRPLAELRSAGATPWVRPHSLVSGSTSGTDRLGGELIQFTSGSTSDPSGVRIPFDRVAANIDRTICRMEFPSGGRTVSWLPLSHDMGLVGMLLTSICAGASRYGGRYDTTLLATEWFASRPQRWLETVSERRAWFTGSPPSILPLITRMASRHSGQLDVASLEHLVLGSEMVVPQVVEEFQRAFADRGMRSSSMRPAYGMAEFGVSLSVDGPSASWRSVTLDPDELSRGSVVENDGGRRYTLLGHPLDGYSIRADAPSGKLGRIHVNGPSAFVGYLGSERAGPDLDGSHLSSDCGALVGGQVLVVGRYDDVIIVGGRNLYLSDIDQAVYRTGRVRSANVQSVATGPGAYALVVEGQRRDGQQSRELSAACRHECGLAPDGVHFVPKGTLQRTSSGKPRRRMTARAAGLLP
jgi:fatty-acyl-CoA synthase